MMEKSNDEVDRRELLDEKELPDDDLLDMALDRGDSIADGEKESWTWWMTIRNSTIHAADSGKRSAEPSISDTVMSCVGSEKVTSSTI